MCTHSTRKADEEMFYSFLRDVLISISSQKRKDERKEFSHGNLLKKMVHEYLTLLKEVNIIFNMFLCFKCIALSI